MNAAELKQLSPVDLVARINAGDQEAEGLLVSKYWSGIVLAMEMRGATPDQARDLAQESCWRTILRLRESPIDEPEKLSGFLRTTAKYLHNNEWHKAQRQKTQSDSDNIEMYGGESNEAVMSLLESETREAVRLLIERVDHERYREILRRHYIANETKKEICVAMRIESRAYDKAISRARGSFRKLIEKLDPSVRAVLMPWKLELE